MPALLLREVDQIVLSGQGRYESRQEFIAEAVQSQVLEVKHGSTEDGQLLLSREFPRPADEGSPSASANGNGSSPADPAAAAADEQPALPAALADGEPVVAATDIAQTALVPVTRGTAIEDGVAVFKREPLFGLHNRDYPSLWALGMVARMAAEGPVPAAQVYAEITQEGWRFASTLAELEKTLPGKTTALFPTNIAKPQSAEEGFRAFALGSINRRPNADGTFDTAGPFYSWRVVQLVRAENGKPSLGLTAAGWDLVEAMSGLTLAWPHEHPFAERFLAHLRTHAPWDWAGFEQLLSITEQRPTRPELAAHFGRWQPAWSEAMRNTNASGFVARAREWGLLEAKLIDGRYALTEYGASMLTERRAV